MAPHSCKGLLKNQIKEMESKGDSSIPAEVTSNSNGTGGETENGWSDNPCKCNVLIVISVLKNCLFIIAC